MEIQHAEQGKTRDMAHELITQADQAIREAEYLCLTVRQYARLERIHPITVYRQIQRGEVRGVVRHGRAIRIRVKRRAPTETEMR
jgi:DNA-binding transcriptional regulator YhcF (GntR family)